MLENLFPFTVTADRWQEVISGLIFVALVNGALFFVYTAAILLAYKVLG